MNIVDDIAKEMILREDETNHDIAHFLKVASYCRLLAQEESLAQVEVDRIVITGLLHDIGCPICRVKYGNTAGPLQEKEGAILAEELLQKYALSKEVKDRIVYLVGHHHTLSDINGIDYQILIEADYLVNADESKYAKEAIESFYTNYFKTTTGKQLLKKMYLK